MNSIRGKAMGVTLESVYYFPMEVVTVGASGYVILAKAYGYNKTRLGASSGHDMRAPVNADK